MAEPGWLSDPIGRINNLSLAPSPKNILQPLFEALMNSIHAIEERFGRDRLSSGVIDIEMTENDQGSYTGFVITDNGIGMNAENMISFRRSDSMKKVEFGGKGVGRLLWLKVADKIAVSSNYHNGTGTASIAFDFVADPDEPIANLEEGPASGEIGTMVRLTPLKTAYALHIPAKPGTVAVRTVAHFINYFVNIDCPKITLMDSEKTIDLLDKFSRDEPRLVWRRL